MIESTSLFTASMASTSISHKVAPRSVHRRSQPYDHSRHKRSTTPMEHRRKKRIKPPSMPSTEIRKYIRIHAKNPRKMLSTASSRPRRGDGPSRSNTPSEGLPELSDVQCYTCRRRHVKCDRILPTCAKCRKKGVPCLGYQKPLRWADGVAVRGKLKGKSKPVVDSNVINLVRSSVQQQVDTALKQAAHLGLHTTDNCCNDVVADQSQLAELMAYYNSTICAERITIKETKVIDRQLAPLSHGVTQKLPRSIVNCILGIAAVHMASRHPGNRAWERLALETKVNIFQSYNRSMKSAENHTDLQPDVVICTGILIFAMDLFEHGMNRWKVHTLGSMHVMSSFGGIENLAFHYPHLQVPFFHVAHFETMWGILSHVPITKPKQITRTALEVLCHSDLVKRKIFNPCPTTLTLALWDVGTCAQTVHGRNHPITFTDMHKREQILLEVLSFQPEDATKSLKDAHGENSTFTDVNAECWNTINAAWNDPTPQPRHHSPFSRRKSSYHKMILVLSTAASRTI
ncbi:hypothetical protein CC80DRAFT_229743 [Byssothecium circinans]|uniref:Zn(2)-C6 fungal-type domain-containing protein n=1 Tax=Byssothecium circinans TaxID=147558 RepID=A0A6A5U8S9_9PLEO|nr:hypothetical protein CC80DRAFT_229743 [Byssothecium circinans]